MYKILIEDNQDLNEHGLVDGMDNITTKMKPLSKDNLNKANSEIEVGELVLNPNTLTIHKALGKRHSKGGTPVNLPENSFIFSNFKDLAFTKNDKKRFEFEMGGAKAKNNTPAKILEKQIDLKHHNKMINILNSKMQDDIAKTSAELMLTKNVKTLGKVAFVQEEKKGFPQGIPPFSQGTAPVYDKSVDQEITQTTQYMKHGGTIIPKYQIGALHQTYTPEVKKWAELEQLMLYPEINWNGIQHSNNGIYDQASIDEFKKRNQWFFNKYPNANMTNPLDVQKFQKEYNNLYSNEFNNEKYFRGVNPDRGTDGMLGNITYNAPAFIHKNIANTSNYSDFDRENADQMDQSMGPIINRNVLNYVNPIRNNQTIDRINPVAYTNSYKPNIQGNITNTTSSGLVPGDVGYEVRSNQEANQVGLSPWQNFNLAYPLLKKASIKSQYPLYQQQQSVVPEQTLMSAQPLLNRIDQDYNQAANLNRVVSPNLSYASNSELFGKKLDASNQAIANVNQANGQIQNQQNLLSAQTFNNDMVNNLKFNKQYYDELQTTIQNKERYKDFYDNQFLTNANDMLSKNQAFNNMLNTQRQYKTNKIMGYSNGKPIYAAEPLYLAKQNNVGNTFEYNQNIDPNIVFDQQFNSTDNGMNNQYVKQLQSDLERARESGDYRAIASLQSTLARYLGKGIPQQKKGGFIPKFKL